MRQGPYRLHPAPHQLKFSDVSQRSRTGLTGADTGIVSMNTDPELPTDVLTLVEEVARVEKRDVVTGRVRIATHTDTVDQTVRETLEGQTVEVSRIAVDRMLQPGEPVPQIRTEGDLTVIPVLEEVLVVEKRLVLKEEVRVLRRVETGVFEEMVALHRQSAVIDHLEPNEATSTEGA